jgi:hypothetical protein
LLKPRQGLFYYSVNDHGLRFLWDTDGADRTDFLNNKNGFIRSIRLIRVPFKSPGL